MVSIARESVKRPPAVMPTIGCGVSYMHLIAYTHSGETWSVGYGFATLTVVGFLWAAMGGAGTALAAFLEGEEVAEFLIPLTAIFAAWLVESWVEGMVATHNS